MNYTGSYSGFFVPPFVAGEDEMVDDVVGFGHGRSRSQTITVESYGAKSARLSAMAACGLRVPPSIALPISACRKALSTNGDVSVSFQVDISRGVRGLQRATRKWLSDKDDPLILAVRLSPARAQGGLGLPVIYIGWTQEAIAILPTPEQQVHASKILSDTIRELAVHVFGVSEQLFEEVLEEAEAAGAIDWISLCESFIDLAVSETEGGFPLSPSDQLILAVKTVWQAWYRPRAKTYRQLYEIDDAGGIGVLIQANTPWADEEEVSRGWLTVRCEETGVRKITGEIYPHDGDGKALDLARRTRRPVVQDLINQATLWESKSARAERLDFIIAGDEAYVIDGTALPLSTAADVTFLVEMAEMGAISKRDALQRLDPARLIDVLHARLDSRQKLQPLATGLSASPGAASGRIAFTASDAEALKSNGDDVILVRPETTPDDIRGLHAASAIITIRGGLTSHAAVIARGTGKPCIVSASALKIDEKERRLEIGDKVFQDGDEVTVDGSSGLILEGRLPLTPSDVSGNLSTLLEWADGFRRMKVLTNVEKPDDAEIALRFGAEGIGLCRTEHMLFQADRLAVLRRVILSETEENRIAASKELTPLLRKDFEALFTVMGDKPVTVRLFDPPLHEFLPKTKKEIAALAKDLGRDAEDLEFTISALSETNPMLGNRGCRLLICNPELAQTLVQVVFEAVISVSKALKTDIKPEIMVPLVAMSREFITISRLIDDAAQTVEQASDHTLHYKVGSMIELPRTAMIADRIAAEADFFSFGTNDLTQTTFGISRDDAVAFLTTYEKMGLMDSDPFVSIDEDGVGAVIEMATRRGREANPDLQIGICGEHGGDPASIHFCERLGLDYVSCSPFRVPIARLAAAQATLAQE